MIYHTSSVSLVRWAGGACISLCLAMSTFAEARDPIVYVNPKAPAVELPKYAGDYYEATVPDTLDIAERARLSVRCA